MHEEISKLPIVKYSRQGKVRDIYELGDTLLLVTSDRISAFDVVFPEPIPDKGKILNSISAHFFKSTQHIVPNHFISDDVDEYPTELHAYRDYLAGRSMLVRKTRVIPWLYKRLCVERICQNQYHWQDANCRGDAGKPEVYAPPVYSQHQGG